MTIDKQDNSTKLVHNTIAGTWQNTNVDSTGIIRIEFINRSGLLYIQGFINSGSEPLALGETRVKVYADSRDSTDANKFTAQYQFDLIELKFHGWVKLGVLVISVFNRYKSNRGQSNFFNREFFHLVD